MSGEIKQGRLGWAVTVSGVVLLVLGLAFLFAPQWMGVSVFGRNDVEPMASLLGTALIGFGAMNWLARGSTAGGTYARPLVAGNLMHFLAGALFLIKHGSVVGVPGAFWILAILYVLGAALFGYLLLGSGVRRP